MAIALYFAILKVRPTPLLRHGRDRGALDDANVVRYARYLRQMSDKTQFIVITHRRGTMEEGRRALRRDHAGAGCQPDADDQSE